MPQGQGEVVPRRTLALATLAGVLYYLGFHPLSWWPLTFAGAALLVRLLARAETPREAALAAAVMKAVALVPTVTYLSGLGIAVHLAAVGIHVACWAAMGWGFFRLREASGALGALLALPGLWTLAERIGTEVHFLPSHVTTWSQALAEPGLALAPFVGVHGLTAVPVALVCAAWGALHARTLPKSHRARAWAFLGAGVAAFLAPPLVGWSVEPPATPPSRPPLRVLAFSLEGNDAMEEHLERGAPSPERAKAIEAHVKERVAQLAEMTRGRPADLVLLPEDAIDFTLPESRSLEAYHRLGIENNGLLIEAYRDLARTLEAELAVGLTTLREGKRFNSTLLIGRDGRLLGLRDKWKLTPGSEYWPVPSWLPLWHLFTGNRQYVKPSETFSAPSSPYPLLTLGSLKLGASTCLEGHMPSMYLGWRRSGAELLLFLGNAHWFHWDPAVFNVHLLRTVRLSAAAYRLPVVMTGKASYAGAIDARGGYRVWPGVLDGGKEEPHEVLIRPESGPPTLATRWGEYYVPLSALVAVVAALAGAGLRLRP